MSDRATPDAKGAQPEQLVEHVAAALEIAERLSKAEPWAIDQSTLVCHLRVLSEDLPDLAAALSECRERRDEYQVRARAAARVISRRGLIPEYDYEYELLTAQPPSEASERSSNG